MESGRAWKIIGAIVLAIGIVITATPFGIAHVCEGKMELKGGMSPAADVMSQKNDMMSSDMGGKTAASEKVATSGKLVPMKCNYMGVSEVFLGLLVAFTGLFILLAKSGQRSLLLILGLLGLTVILMPTSIGIGICAKAGMACHTTKAFLTIMGIATLAVAAVGLLTRRLHS